MPYHAILLYRVWLHQRERGNIQGRKFRTGSRGVLGSRCLHSEQKAQIADCIPPIYFYAPASNLNYDITSRM